MKRKYIIPVLLLCFTACTSEEETNTVPVADRAVGLSAAINGGSSTRADADDEDEEYLHKYFLNEDNTEGGRQSRIRVINTVNYSTPDFTDDTQYKEYKYVGTGDGTDDNTKPNFEPETEGEGFDWDEISPTAASFVFEAACYPNGYTPFTEVATDQSDIANFLKADLLLAHHRQDLNARYDLVKLRFWHAFAMIKVIVELDVAPPTLPGGFPQDAITEARLVKRQRGYTVDYTSAIPNDGLRSATATGDDSTPIKMYQLPKENETGPGGTVTRQRYVYCGIIPAQNIEEGEDLVEFTINTYSGVMISEGVYEEAEPKEYVFTRTDQNIPIQAAHITVLTLGVEQEVPEMIYLGATVKSWDERYTEMVLEPKATE